MNPNRVILKNINAVRYLKHQVLFTVPFPSYALTLNQNMYYAVTFTHRYHDAYPVTSIPQMF